MNDEPQNQFDIQHQTSKYVCKNTFTNMTAFLREGGQLMHHTMFQLELNYFKINYDISDLQLMTFMRYFYRFAISFIYYASFQGPGKHDFVCNKNITINIKDKSVFQLIVSRLIQFTSISGQFHKIMLQKILNY